MSQYRKPQPAGEPSAAARVAGIVGGLVGVGVGQYAACALLVPGGVALVIGLTLAAFLQMPRKAFAAAVAIPVGHATWMLVAMILLKAFDPVFVAEALALLLLPWLLLFTPPLIVAIPLALYQVVGLVVNAMALAELPGGSEMHKAIVVHIFLRVCTLGAMWWAVVIWYTTEHEPVRRYGRDRREDDRDDESDVEPLDDPRDDDSPPRPRRRIDPDGDRPWKYRS